MISDMKGGSEGAALGAKTARACDSCLRRRARWFCGADDAFLCHGCDTLVHSANQLASRHERVRLQTASSKVTTTWHSGFTRKARTPRSHHNKQQRLKDQVFLLNRTNSVLPLVPELGGDQEQLLDIDHEADQLCRVPVFDPFDQEEEAHDHQLDSSNFCDQFDVDLAEFAANVESLLHDEDSPSCQVFDYDYKEGNEMGAPSMVVKVKDELEIDDLESVLDMTNQEDFHNWNIDSVLSQAQEEKENKESLVGIGEGVNDSIKEETTKRDIFLRLNYEEVISAWASQGSPSPWTNGNPPKDYDYDCWQNCLGSSGGVDGGVMRSLRGYPDDGGREARVSRYRQKRRTRLFAKKIRYEVRKLNAEKRPRMKGRFVKRSSCFVNGATTTAFPTYHH